MVHSIFIDGAEGTTGLQIRTRLEGRDDLSLLTLGDADRKDPEKRAAMLNACDVAILCLPDDAAREAVAMIENPDVRVIDASTAHRTAEGWDYGFPEMDTGQAAIIASSKRVANTGCYAVASVAILHPLVEDGLLPSDWPVTINAVSGYSGGGKKMIAGFEDPTAPDRIDTPFRVYGLNLGHKHTSGNTVLVGTETHAYFRAQRWALPRRHDRASAVAPWRIARRTQCRGSSRHSGRPLRGSPVRDRCRSGERRRCPGPRSGRTQRHQ